jgi:type IV secretory pathway TrbL component
VYVILLLLVFHKFLKTDRHFALKVDSIVCDSFIGPNKSLTLRLVYNYLTLTYCFQSLAATMAAMIGSGIIVQRIPYKEGFGAKQVAWMAHTAILGAVVAPLCFIGGPLVVRAAW